MTEQLNLKNKYSESDMTEAAISMAVDTFRYFFPTEQMKIEKNNEQVLLTFMEFKKIMREGLDEEESNDLKMIQERDSRMKDANSSGDYIWHSIVTKDYDENGRAYLTKEIVNLHFARKAQNRMTTDKITSINVDELTERRLKPNQAIVQSYKNKDLLRDIKMVAYNPKTGAYHEFTKGPWTEDELDFEKFSKQNQEEWKQIRDFLNENKI